MKYAFEISDVRGDYLRDCDFRRFAGTPLRLLKHLGASEFRRGGFVERSSNSAPNSASSLCSCRVIADGVRNRRSAAPAMDPAWANSTSACKSSSTGSS